SGVQVATRVDVELQATVAGHEIEHVVEETNSRFALTLTKTVEAELDRDGGLSRGALDLGSASHCRPLSRMRASIDRACVSKPSARATGAASRAILEPSLIRTSVKLRRKCAGTSAEAKRAAPLVGRTWFEPAM